jgi:hypothetical protein
VLLPAGIALAWILNSVRIAILILIGTWRPSLALDGFHSVAGWRSLNLLRPCPGKPAPGSVSQRSVRRGFIADPCRAVSRSDARAYRDCADFAGDSPGFDLLYPARVIVAALVLWHYRHELAAHTIKITPFAFAIGIIVFLGRILLARPCAPAADTAFAASLDGFRQLPDSPGCSLESSARL